MLKDTTNILLFRGWNKQQCSSAPVMSLIVLMHSPDATFHNLAVLSYDTDRIMSLERDHTKSGRQYEMWFHNVEHLIGTCVYSNTKTQTAVMTL